MAVETAYNKLFNAPTGSVKRPTEKYDMDWVVREDDNSWANHAKTQERLEKCKLTFMYAN